jgi:RHS repeat-associated protein
MAYDPMGRRTSRTVTAVDEGSGSSLTEYWYGKSLMPLVIERDGKTYRMLAGLVIEERVDGKATTQYYPHSDYLSSVRVVTDASGSVIASLGYDGDRGSARIAGEDYVSSDDGMESFYRFQSQEAEIFPLIALNIQDSALENWLDELQLYHFPYRDYSAGLGAFLSHDPAQQSVSPYSAFGANPANITDPTGAVFWWQTARFREPLFVFIWGFVSVGIVEFFGEDYFGTESNWIFESVAFTIGRFTALVADGLLSTYGAPIDNHGRHFVVSGPAALSYDPRSNAFEDLMFQEFTEALAGQFLYWIVHLAMQRQGEGARDSSTAGYAGFFAIIVIR